MAINKVINDATKKYEPVTTETLVLDSVPTEGSFNAVTSDGVAKAIAEGGGGVPDVTDPLYIDTDDAVALRYGSGLYLEDGENYNDTLAVALSGTGGLYYDTMEDNALAVQVDPAGGLENYIDDGVQVGLRAKVDGTTIGVNASGELEALGGGGGSYTAGNGIEISGQNAISAKADASGAISVGSNGIGVITDNTTIESEYSATTLTSEERLGTSPFYIPRSVTVTSSNTCTLKLVPDNTLTITAPAEANGCPLVCRLKTLYSISTWYYTWPNGSALFYDGNNNAMYLQTGSNTVSTTLTLQDQSFGSTTFAQYFYPDRGTDWDTILGDGLLCVEFGYAADEFTFVFGTLSVSSSDCHVEIVTDAGAHSTLKVVNPLPASLGTAGQVLTVNSGATGVEWASPSSGGGDAFVATYGTTTNAEVLAAWDAGKAVFAQRIFGGNSPALYAFATKRDMNTGAFVFMCQTIDTSDSELDISIWTLSYQNQWSDTSWSISVTQ